MCLYVGNSLHRGNCLIDWLCIWLIYWFVVNHKCHSFTLHIHQTHYVLWLKLVHWTHTPLFCQTDLCVLAAEDVAPSVLMQTMAKVHTSNNLLSSSPLEGTFKGPNLSIHLSHCSPASTSLLALFRSSTERYLRKQALSHDWHFGRMDSYRYRHTAWAVWA